MLYIFHGTYYLILTIIYPQMLKVLYWFTIFLLLYFVISVTASYYLFDVTYGNLMLPIIKELTWFAILWYVMWRYRSKVVLFFQYTKLLWLLIAGIAVRGVVATVLIYQSQWVMDLSVWINILIWLKYGLYATVIFYTAGLMWFTSTLTESDLSHYIRFICKAILWFLIIWLIWQWLKRSVPDLFYNILWYGPVGDYIVGQAHPIYYRTGAGGFPRFSGLMSGPNNLWYLLVAYASVVPLYFTQRRVKLLYYGSTLATLSRAAMLGVGTQLVMTATKWIRRNRMLIFVLAGIWLLAVIALSIIKWASTREHLTRSFDSLQKVIQSPWWIGLWSSWPWVHRGWSVLPENFYLQLLLDYGTIPFIARCGLWYMIIQQCKTISELGYQLSWQLRGYLAGFVGLLLVGLFLHVFEDSIVNYLFFIPFGLLWGQWLRTLAKSWPSVYNQS